MKNRIAIKLILATLLVTSLTGCSSTKKEMLQSMQNNQSIKISTEEPVLVDKEKLDWIELDQLQTHKSLRNTWDDTLNIVKFDRGSKNGVLFVDLNGNWTGNNTMLNVFRNKAFIKNYWDDSKVKSKLAQSAMDEFKDITNESTGLIASTNAYFNILQGNTDGTSGLMNKLTRAEVMSAIYRADTPVVFQEEQSEFTTAVGESEYNLYAQNVVSQSYLDYTNGSLNTDNYNSVMTRAEAIYIIVQRYFSDLYNTVSIKEISFNDCKNAGDIARKNKFIQVVDKKTNEEIPGYAYQAYELEYALQNLKDGAPETLYKALVVANKLGIIDSNTRWNEGVTGGELINFLIKAYTSINQQQDFAVNAKQGENTGNSLWTKPEIETAEEPETEIIEEPKEEPEVDIADTDNMLEVYGDEFELTDEEYEEAKSVLDGFTIEDCDKWMLVNSNVNVRVGPSTEFRVVSSLAYKVKVHVTGRCEETGWYRIAANKKIAYVCGAYLSDLPQDETTKEFETTKELGETLSDDENTETDNQETEKKN